VGPWHHASFAGFVGEVDFGFRASGMLLDLKEDLTGLHRRWFDARLKGIPSGIDSEPPVKLFVMGRNRWRDEDAWPLERAKVQRWHVHATGALSERPPERSEPSLFTLDPDDPVPTHGGTLLMNGSYIRGPRDQARVEARQDVLVFTSEPMAHELEVTGRVRFNAWVAAETVDTDVVARLCDMGPDGRSFNIMDGILRLRFRNGLYNPKPLTPGEPVQVSVDLWSTSHVFLPGHRIRLQVCASDFPRYDRCPGSGESSTVAKKVLPSHVELPVVGS
jgi:putative CocE/NonD family hydrolase